MGIRASTFAFLIAPASFQEAPPPAPPPAREPKGLAGVGLTAEQVNRAIERGSACLWNLLRTSDHAAKEGLGERENHVLACLALVHAEAHRRFPDFDANLREYLARDVAEMGRWGYRTYHAGLYCMLVDAYGDPQFLPQLRTVARYLVEAQGTAGSWDYGFELPVEATGAGPADGEILEVAGGMALDGSDSRRQEWKRLTDWDVGRDGDSSNAQYAILGLNAVERSGFVMPRESWSRAIALFRSRQDEDGGFWYSGRGRSYGSMCCAGVASLAIARSRAGTSDPEDARAIRNGLAWLAKNFDASAHPGSASRKEWLYYYLYSVERVGRLLDVEFVGDHEWYPEGARFLVDHQGSDGSWIGSEQEADPRLATSFALLFLTKATAPLAVQLKRGGAGTLRTQVDLPPVRLYVILDCSGSMLDEIGGRPKFDVARAAVTALLRDLPDDSEVALRVYGHRKRGQEQGASEDVELLAPLKRLDRDGRDALVGAIGGLRARGKTPLALSLREAAADLAKREGGKPVLVLLLTDGGEDTRPMQDPVAAAAELAALDGVDLRIVGFDVERRDDWRAQLNEMTQVADGRFLPAADVSLESQLRAAVFGDDEGRGRIRFELVDAAGRALEPGWFGEPRQLPEGKYRLAATVRGRRHEAELWINTDATTSVRLDATRIPVAAAGAACAACGEALAAGARFCARCGARAGG
jgi:hypothetical protein